MAAMRYLVNDVEAAVEFYVGLLEFVLDERWGPAMAIVSREDVKLWLAGSRASAARPMPDGRKPEPGGWNRVALEVKDISETAAHLKEAGVTFRNDVISGPGGSQVLIEDPSGNPIELLHSVVHLHGLSGHFFPCEALRPSKSLGHQSFSKTIMHENGAHGPGQVIWGGGVNY
jgi:catechol 2,3-dioxygenase-like lactoylglutathione lyase family enzyme